jgi:phage/plasmid-associated DNA primase
LQRLLKRRKFVPPPSSSDVLADYRTGSDSVVKLSAECLLLGDEGKVVSELYGAYREFCQANGFKPTNSAAFGRKLTDLGIAGLGEKASGKPFGAARLTNGSGVIFANIGGKQSPDHSIAPNGAAKRTKISLAEMLGDMEEVVSNDLAKARLFS